MFQPLSNREARHLDALMFHAERENKGLLSQRHRSQFILEQRAATTSEIVSIRDILYLEKGDFHDCTKDLYPVHSGHSQACCCQAWPQAFPSANNLRA